MSQIEDELASLRAEVAELRGRLDSPVGFRARVRRRITFANVAATFAVFLVLSTGTAVALAGSNTVFSDDIVDGAVHTSDLANSSVTGTKIKDKSITRSDLAVPAWLNVAANPLASTDPCSSGATAQFCGLKNSFAMPLAWANYNNGFQTARFVKDDLGEVHVQGLVTLLDLQGATNTIFVLPAGYRPAATLVFSVDCAGPDTETPHGRVDVASSGVVSWALISPACEPTTYLSLTGIAFRAEH